MNLLEAEILTRISRDGPITFRDFMEAALYHPIHGYYNTPRPKIGPLGDYYTSSNLHAAFGQVLAQGFIELWARAGEPSSRLTIAEIGAGTGQLASDILDAFGRLDRGSVSPRYIIVERSPAMRARQRQKLKQRQDRLEWLQLAEITEPLEGIIFSNELFDSLPVHRVRRMPAGWEEQYVVATGGWSGAHPGDRNRLNAAWGDLSRSELGDYLRGFDDRIPEGQILEVNLDGLDLLRQVSRILARGFLITIDYGDTAEQIHAPSRREGTLRSFYRHRLSTDLLDRPGEQDITASVNFTGLIEWGKDLGLELVSFERQAAYLLRMGLADVAAAAATDETRCIAGRLALKNLFVPGGISDNFRVLIQRKI
jgi:SAM-dependent MidA family methyltransferase